MKKFFFKILSLSLVHQFLSLTVPKNMSWPSLPRMCLDLVELDKNVHATCINEWS